MRRLRARPPSVRLSAIGRRAAKPRVRNRSAGTPRATSASRTAAARASLKPRLNLLRPTGSVWPSMRITPGQPRTSLASPRRRLLAGERDGLAGGRDAYPAEARGGEPTACLARDTAFDPVVRHGSHCERRDERESRERQQAAPEERPDGRVAPQERMRSQDCHALHRNLRSVLPRRSWFIHSTENGASSLAARATLARSKQGENDLKFAQGTANRDDVRARTHTRLQREIESWNCQDLPLIPRLAG